MVGRDGRLSFARFRSLKGRKAGYITTVTFSALRHCVLRELNLRLVLSIVLALRENLCTVEA